MPSTPQAPALDFTFSQASSRVRADQTNPKQLSIGEVLFSQDDLDHAARESGFIKRQPRKITTLNLLAALVEESLCGSPSYNDLAARIETNDRADPSRQAVALRLGQPFEDFLKTLLGRVIFKAWKSHLKFDVLQRVSARQLRIVLKTRLLVIAAASNLYRKFERALWLKHRRRLSLLKFMNYLAASMSRLKRVVSSLPNDAPETTAIEKALARYCCYDNRQKRLNFAEIWELLA